LVKEKIERLCAKGKVAIDLRGSQYLQAQQGEDENTAWSRVRGKLGTGKHLEETKLLLPQAVPQSGEIKKPGELFPPKPDTDDEETGGAGDDGTPPDGDPPIGGDGSDSEPDTDTGTGGGGIFGGGRKKTYSAPATGPLMLLA